MNFTTYQTNWTEGFVLSVGLASILFLFGLITLPILLIGIPFLIGSAVILLASPFVARSYVRGDCPNCDNKIGGFLQSKALTCSFCKRRVLIRQKGFYLA